MSASRLVCHGCGWEPAADDPYPFRCAQARVGDDVDHVLTRQLKIRDLIPESFLDPDPNPFLRYRELFHSHHVARDAGLDDTHYVDIVRRLDDAVASIDGRGFRVTPYEPAPALAEAIGLTSPGALWIKDETENVSGSHKARHLMGIMIWLRVMEALDRIPATERDRPLAIASCGNAALGAAVVAKAAARRLEVFIPTDADPAAVDRLKTLGARLNVCPRHPGVPGDPAYLTFQAAVAAGALPFTCQGNENGLTIEGGKTIGWELVSAWQAGAPVPDRLVLQVGGAALGSAVVQALFEARALGLIEKLPAIDAVQTESCHPLDRAHRLLLEQVGGDAARALERLPYAATHRHEFMWPWENLPHSIAHGILDDETYDWLELLRGTLITAGRFIVVGEESLQTAFDLAHKVTTINASPTGTSGLAGLITELCDPGLSRNSVPAVLVTGSLR